MSSNEMTESTEALQIVKEAFEWFSRVGRREIPLSQADMARYFDDDVQMTVGGVIKASGIKGLYDRFVEMLEQTEWFEAGPTEPSISAGSRACSYGRYRFVHRDGKSGTVHSISIWTLRAGRIAEIFEVASFDGRPLDLADHGEGAGRQI